MIGNRPGWENVPIVQQLAEDTGLPVYLENDVRAAALVRGWFGSQDHEGNALYILVCDGIAGALMQGDGLFEGDRGRAMHFEHIVLQSDGTLSGMRYAGDLESLASDVAFIRMIWPEVGRVTVSERISLVERGVEMALDGDNKAHDALAAICRHLGVAITNAVAILGPQVVSVCGTIVDCAPGVVSNLVRREVFSRLPGHMLGDEVRALRDSKEFLLRGAAGFALWQPYSVLQKDNRSARSVGASGLRDSD